VAGLLQRFCLIELQLRDLFHSHQAGSDRLWILAQRRSHHPTALEGHRPRRLANLGGHPQHPGLAAQVDQLEHVLDVELL